MSLITVTGALKDDARIETGQNKRFLRCVVVERRPGFGQYAGRVFKKYFKVVVFGNDIDQLASQLVAGTLVEAMGEPDVEVYQAKNSGEHKGVIKIVGRVKLVLTSDEPPNEGAPGAETGADGVPF